MTEPDFLRDTRASYDAVAVGYAARFGHELAAKPLDRAMLAGFAELVRAAGPGPVAGSGPVAELVRAAGRVRSPTSGAAPAG